MNKAFSTLLEYYVLTYAKKEVGLSGNTLRSYYTAIDQFVKWLEKYKNINIINIDPSSFCVDNIREFLLYLENEKTISPVTRNLRRAAIVSFLEYASKESSVYTESYINAKKIKVKKVPKFEKSFLSLDELKAIFDSININSQIGYNHFLLLTVMYDAALRVDEAVKVNIEDFKFGNENYLTVFGKGSKYRKIYLTSHTAKILLKYKTTLTKTEGPLFTNKSGNRITDSGIDYILKKYAKIAEEKITSLKNKKISPHILRRSKATHMLLSGASLPVIQRFLGHESITTTQVYLDNGTESIKNAIEKSEKILIEHGLSNNNEVSYDNKDILKKLKNLAK